jgi:hypothetical protein
MTPVFLTPKGSHWMWHLLRPAARPCKIRNQIRTHKWYRIPPVTALIQIRFQGLHTPLWLNCMGASNLSATRIWTRTSDHKHSRTSWKSHRRDPLLPTNIQSSAAQNPGNWAPSLTSISIRKRAWCALTWNIWLSRRVCSCQMRAPQPPWSSTTCKSTWISWRHNSLDRTSASRMLI